MLSEATIQELKQILKEEYKQDVDLREASEIGNAFVNYFGLLAKIYQKEKFKNENNYGEHKTTNK